MSGSSTGIQGRRSLLESRRMPRIRESDSSSSEDESDDVVSFKGDSGVKSLGIDSDTTEVLTNGTQAGEGSGSHQSRGGRTARVRPGVRSRERRTGSSEQGTTTQTPTQVQPRGIRTGMLKNVWRWIVKKWNWEAVTVLGLLVLIVSVGYWMVTWGPEAVELMWDKVYTACEMQLEKHFQLCITGGIVLGLFVTYWMIRGSCGDTFEDYEHFEDPEARQEQIRMERIQQRRGIKRDKKAELIAKLEQNNKNVVQLKKDTVSYKRVFVGTGSKEEWKDYKIYFDRIAETNGWSEDIKLHRMMLSLRGDAESYANGMPASKRSTFKDLLEAMNKRFGTFERTTTYVSESELRFKGEKENYREFAQALEQICHKAYPGDHQTVDTMSMERFIKQCGPPILGHHIRLGRPANLMEAVELAVYFDYVVKGTEKIDQKRQVASVSPYSADQAVLIDQSNRDVSMQQAYPAFQAEGPRTYPTQGTGFRGRGRGRGRGGSFSGQQRLVTGACFGCGSRDHYQKDCPDQGNEGSAQGQRPPSRMQQQDPGTDRSCYNCGGLGHFARDCTESDRRNPGFRGGRGGRGGVTRGRGGTQGRGRGGGLSSSGGDSRSTPTDASGQNPGGATADASQNQGN